MSAKIIFLDIDGPMIPTRAYIWDHMASYSQLLDEMCVKVLRAIIGQTGAQIVFNTTHNRMLEPADGMPWPGLRRQFISAGFRDNIHPDDHTVYPGVDRTTAIREWLARHPTETWVAFDDVKIDDERAYLTDADHGIGWGEYQHAKQWLLGEKPSAVLI